MFGELFDRIAAIEQDALVAVDIGDLGFAACGRGEAGIEGEHPGLAVQFGNIGDLRTDCAVLDRHVHRLVAEINLAASLMRIAFSLPTQSARRGLPGSYALRARCGETRENCALHISS